MDSKDKIIKKLLGSESPIKAPANFTSTVMDAILVAEEKKKPIFQTDTFLVMMSLFVSIVSSILVFYYFNASIFQNIPQYLAKQNFGFSLNVSSLFISINEQLENIKSLFVSSPIILPLVLSLTALLIIERFISKSKYGLNIFVSI